MRIQPAGCQGRRTAPVLVLDTASANDMCDVLNIDHRGRIVPGELLSRISHAENAMHIGGAHRALGYIHFVLQRDSYRRARWPWGVPHFCLFHPMTHRDRVLVAGQMQALTDMAEWAIKHRVHIEWG